MTLFDEDIMHLATRIGQELVRRNWKIAVAESCTGGLLAGAITAVSGASRWFESGFVTYSNDAKIAHLQVSPETLELYGAVSEPIALEMAMGVLLASPLAQIAVATTGIAGPEGGMPSKPVGMVCLGFALRASATEGITAFAATHCFAGDRDQIRIQAGVAALCGVWEMLESRESV